MLAMFRRELERRSDFQGYRGAAGARIEDERGELQLFVHEADEETPLDIELCLERPRSLCHTAELQPRCRLVCHPGPRVIKIA